MKKCKMCTDRLKDWNGDDPICAFSFDFNLNWNCATVNAIRDICYEGRELPYGVSYQYCEDYKYATINTTGIEVRGRPIGMALWVAWYKNRGRTDALWLLDSSGEPRQPSEEELRAVICAYKKATK